MFFKVSIPSQVYTKQIERHIPLLLLDYGLAFGKAHGRDPGTHPSLLVSPVVVFPHYPLWLRVPGSVDGRLLKDHHVETAPKSSHDVTVSACGHHLGVAQSLSHELCVEDTCVEHDPAAETEGAAPAKES